MTVPADLSLADYLDQLAKRTPTPGGGAAAAVSAAQGAALVCMVAGFTKDHHDETAGIISRAKDAVGSFAGLADDDTKAFGKVMAAFKAKDKTTLDEALIEAATVPSTLIDLAVSLLDDLATLSRIGNPNLISDVAIAAELLKTGMVSAELNILINLRQLSGEVDTTAFSDRLAALPGHYSRLDRVAAEIKLGLTSS